MLVSFLIYLVILVVVLWFLWWLLQQIELPDPFPKLLRIVIVAIGVIVLIDLLLGITGHGSFLGLPRLR